MSDHVEIRNSFIDIINGQMKIAVPLDLLVDLAVMICLLRNKSFNFFKYLNFEMYKLRQICRSKSDNFELPRSTNEVSK